MTTKPAEQTRNLTRSLAPPIVAAWAGVWLVTVLLNLGRQALLGESIDVLGAATHDLPILLIWLTATPLVLASGRRWPLRSDLGRMVLHVALGTAFVVFANLVIRVPILLDSGGTAWLRDTGLGLVRYAPPALVLYLGLVWLGVKLGEPTAREASAGGDEDASHDPPLVLKGSLRTHLVRPEEIAWLEADDNYVVVHRTGAKSLRIRERISSFEERLAGHGFLRVHRSSLVRLDAIRELQPLGKGDLVAVLSDGAEVRVSRGRRQELESAVGAPL